MKREIQSYLVFTSGIYRWLLFVLVPVAAVGMQAAAAALFLALEEYGVELGQMSALADWVMFAEAVLLVQAEVLLDSYAFGGIAIKGGASLEFLKSSPKGLLMMRSALRTDLVRIWLEGTAALALGRGIWAIPVRGLGETLGLRDWILILAVALLAYFVTVASHLVIRHFNSLQVTTCVESLGWLALLALWNLCRWNRGVMLAVLAALSLGISALSQWKIMKRVEESYYDERA